MALDFKSAFELHMYVLGDETYILAAGSTSKQVTFKIKSSKVGDRVVENVRGSVASSSGILLLGQSFLERFRLGLSTILITNFYSSLSKVITIFFQ